MAVVHHAAISYCEVIVSSDVPEAAWEADPAGVFFSDRFNVPPDVLTEYGAFDISVIAKLQTELEISRRAIELLKEENSPKGGTRPSR